MTLALFNYFGEKLKNKYLQDGEPEDIDLDDWSWLSGNYQNTIKNTLW